MTTFDHDLNKPSRLRYVILAVLVLVLHYVANRQVEVFDIRPNVLLLVTCLAVLTMRFRSATLTAFLCGLGADLFTVVPFGTSALAFLLAAVVATPIARNARSSAIVQTIITFAVSFLGTVAFVLLSRLNGEAAGSAAHILWVAVVVSVLNAVLTPPVLFLYGLTKGDRPVLTPALRPGADW